MIVANVFLTLKFKGLLNIELQTNNFNLYVFMSKNLQKKLYLISGCSAAW